MVGRFDGSRLTTVGDGLLLRHADRKIGLLRRVVGCFTDGRQPEQVEHELPEMLAQRIYGLALARACLRVLLRLRPGRKQYNQDQEKKDRKQKQKAGNE